MYSHKISIYRIVYILTAGLLLLIYICNIPKTPTLFELPDETGYLWNAAWFLGIDWDDLGKSVFYGYGYSIFLIPLFRLCNSGIALIKGAYIINIFFVMGMYIVFSKLLKNIWGRYSICIPMISAISCMTPYLFTHAYKVLCENCLSFFCSLLILLFYKSIDTGKIRYYLFLAAVAAFIPFIHTRGIVCSGICTAFIILDFLIKKKVNRSQILAIIAGCGLFLVFFFIKKQNIEFRDALRVSGGYGTDNTNIITVSWLKKRFWNFFDSGLLNYLCCFISRFFYVICSTGGVVLFSISHIRFIMDHIRLFVRHNNDMQSKKTYIDDLTILVIMVNILGAIIASVFNSIGYNFQYVYYGRYYEHMIPIMLCCSLCLIYNHYYIVKPKLCLGIISIIIITGLLSYQWVCAYLDKIDISVDTCRTAAFSSVIVRSKTYIDVICGLCLISVLPTIIIFITNNNYKKKIAAIVVIGFILWDMSDSCIKNIQNTSERVIKDNNIWCYITENIDGENIYAINDHSYKWEETIGRAQVFLKDYRVNIIDYNNGDGYKLEQIKGGDYVICYTENKLNFSNEADYTEILRGARFILYQKQG